MEETLESHIKCSVCLGILHDAASITPCLHSFCIGCILQLSDKSCPLCRERVNEITPNLMLRDIVTNYLSLNPELKRSDEEVELMVKLELKYSIEWLAETDEFLLSVGNSGNFSHKFRSMKTRACDLMSQLLNDDTIEKDKVKKAVEKLVHDVRKGVYDISIKKKYREAETTYRKMVNYSATKLVRPLHTWLGNYYYENQTRHDDIDLMTRLRETPEMNIPGKIELTISQLKKQSTTPRISAQRNISVRDVRTTFPERSGLRGAVRAQSTPNRRPRSHVSAPYQVPPSQNQVRQDSAENEGPRRSARIAARNQ